MTTQNQPHHHKYDQISYIREVGTTNPSNLLIHDVSPRMINRIILTRNCECGDSKAFECGSPDEMRELVKRIKDKEKKRCK